MGKPIIHDHDGHIDDLIACLLLWLMPEADLLAVGISDGHCYIEQSYQCLLKIATLLDLEGVEIGLGNELLNNPFREAWRKESFVMNSLPIFSENDLKKPYSQGRPRNSVVMYADCLSHSKAPITFVTTGPLTNIANLLRERANLSDHIEEILITGGAINIPGNVHEEGYEDSAEWNIFADPKAFKSILETRIPIKLIPFDVGSQLPVTKAFRQKLERQAKDHKASELALKLYSLVSTFTYHMMDVLTAIIAVDSSVATFKKMRIDVAQSGKSMGKTGKSFFNGREVEVATAVDVKRVEDKVLSALRSN